MQASSVIEIYTSVLSWHIHNGIWYLLEQSGLFLIPFIVIVIRNLIKAREQKDKNDIGVLAFRMSEVQIYVAFFTVLLLVKPLIDLNIEAVSYTERLCTTNAPDSQGYDLQTSTWGETGTSYDNQSQYITASLDGQVPRIPVLWYPLEFYLRGATESVKHTLPCRPDLRTVSGELTTARILDPVLRDETQQFYRDCWRPSANRFLRDKPEVDAERYENIQEDISWLGSQFFYEHPDYYHFYRTREGLQSFPYLEARDSNVVPESHSEGLGWPYCAAWWGEPDYGLRGRLLDHLNGVAGASSSVIGQESLLEQIQNLGTKLGASLGIQDAEDALLKYALKTDLRVQGVALANNYTRDQAGGFWNAVTSSVSQVAMGAGMIKQNIAHSVEMHTYQFAAPVVQALILMVITLSLPILSVIALYRLDVIFALLMLKFSVIFWSFLFQLAFWLDNFLLEGLLDHSNAEGFLTGIFTLSIGDYAPVVNIIDYITRTLYIVLPGVFSMLMTIAGYKGGVAISDAVGAQGTAAAGASRQAAQTGQNMVAKGISK